MAYVTAYEDGTELLDELKKFMRSDFERELLTDQEKEIARKYEIDYDTQGAY